MPRIVRLFSVVFGLSLATAGVSLADTAPAPAPHSLRAALAAAPQTSGSAGAASPGPAASGASGVNGATAPGGNAPGAAAPGASEPQQGPNTQPTITPKSPSSPSSPAPRTKSGFSYSGNVRAFQFTRQNDVQNAANPNRTALMPGANVHADYRFPQADGLRLGTTYAFADAGNLNGRNPQLNGKIDNTLPGFSLATFDEAYLAYTGHRVDLSVGDRSYNFYWAPSSDSRIKPASYQGADINFTPIAAMTVGVSRIIRFEPRNDSAFGRNTLLTSPVAGASNVIVANTPGALHAYLFANTPSFIAHAENYSFYDLANLQYVDARYIFDRKGRYKPFVAAQYVDEHDTGRRLLGRIANNTVGAQVGLSINQNVGVAFGFDTSPYRYTDVATTSAATATRGIFLPGGGTVSSGLVAPGRYRVAYGGLASPYSDTYASDPLFTTSITQGMVDRRSAGTSFKLGATYLSSNRKLKALVSEAYYRYDDFFAQNRTFEYDVDGQYFFSPVPAKGVYKGFSIRERFANRTQPTIPDDFKYIRTQIQYDF